MSKRLYRTRKIRSRRAASLENPRIRSIRKLLNYHFLIPRYKRGYRWGRQQVTDLLNDILYYHQVLKQNNPFYCLQPVVVKKKKWIDNEEHKIDGWEIIDGQQRLITILLILNYLETVTPLGLKNKLGNDLTFYTIDFDTRPDYKYFFQDKQFTHEIIETNVDFYHISKAYQYIREWFEQDKVKSIFNIENIILDTLLDVENNVSIIWYEQGVYDNNRPNEDSSIDLFSRLTEDKVPLTNAELIKALLLQSDYYPQGEKKFVHHRLLEIAAEWDEMEAKLQDDKMWFFINDQSYQPTSRIEFLFELLSETWNDSNKEALAKLTSDKEKPQYFDFIVFKNHLKKIRIRFRDNLSDQSHVMDPINEIWDEVKSIFALLDGWYNNHQLFHYIGFLFTIYSDDKKEFLKELTRLKLDKDEFLLHIKHKIANEIKLNKDIEELRFGKSEDKKSIIRLLLLMDIEAMLKKDKENVRFPFHLYKKEKINSITHINPHIQPTTEIAAQTWLQHHKQSLMAFKSNADSKETQEIEHLLFLFENLLTNFDGDEYAVVFTKTIAFNNNITGMKEDETNAIPNLVLVDSKTHSQLNNSTYDVKLHLMKENTNGTYIPINTRRVFTKFYSERPQQANVWNATDRQSYCSVIKTVYDSYIQFLSQHNAK